MTNDETIVHPREPIPNELMEQPDFAVSPAVEAEIDELITHYPKKRSASLMLLHAIQEQFGYVSRQAVEWIARKLELEPIGSAKLIQGKVPFVTPSQPGIQQIQVDIKGVKGG